MSPNSAAFTVIAVWLSPLLPFPETTERVSGPTVRTSFREASSAATPVRIGVANDVPDLNCTPPPGSAPRTSSPGARIPFDSYSLPKLLNARRIALARQRTNGKHSWKRRRHMNAIATVVAGRRNY